MGEPRAWASLNIPGAVGLTRPGAGEHSGCLSRYGNKKKTATHRRMAVCLF